MQNYEWHLCEIETEIGTTKHKMCVVFLDEKQEEEEGKFLYQRKIPFTYERNSF